MNSLQKLLYLVLLVYVFSMLAYTVLHPRIKFWGTVLAGLLGAYIGVWSLFGK